MAYFPTVKGWQRMERLRHYFHLDMASLLEADPDVRTWTTAVDALHLESEPNGQGFTPAFRAQGADQIRYIHLVDRPVKSRARIERHAALRKQCRKQGMSFEVLTREQVEAHPRLKTSRDILFYRPFEWPPELPVRTSAVAAVARPKTLGDLHRGLGGGSTLWPQLLSLVSLGYITVDMGTPVGPAIIIRSVSPSGYLQ